MEAWVTQGTPPPTAPQLERVGSGDLARDGDGNAKGGLRLPQIDVPTAAYSGESSGTGYCALTGSAVPFTEAQLAKRYPNPEDYVTQLSAAIDRAVQAGHLLPDDAAELLESTAVPGTSAAAAAIASGEVDVSTPDSAASPPSDAEEAAAPAAPAPTEVAAQQASRSGGGWMATTGRDLLTPLLAGLLLLLNGRVVVTIARQRRRAG
jgi:hypothetical protein